MHLYFIVWQNTRILYYVLAGEGSRRTCQSYSTIVLFLTISFYILKKWRFFGKYFRKHLDNHLETKHLQERVKFHKLDQALYNHLKIFLDNLCENQNLLLPHLAWTLVTTVYINDFEINEQLFSLPGLSSLSKWYDCSLQKLLKRRISSSVHIINSLCSKINWITENSCLAKAR